MHLHTGRFYWRLTICHLVNTIFNISVSSWATVKIKLAARKVTKVHFRRPWFPLVYNRRSGGAQVEYGGKIKSISWGWDWQRGRGQIFFFTIKQPRIACFRQWGSENVKMLTVRENKHIPESDKGVFDSVKAVWRLSHFLIWVCCLIVGICS